MPESSAAPSLQTCREFRLYRIGENLAGYGVGVVLADFIFACWDERSVARIDCLYVRSIGPRVADGLVERMKERLHGHAIPAGPVPIVLVNAAPEFSLFFRTALSRLGAPPRSPK